MSAQWQERPLTDEERGQLYPLWIANTTRMPDLEAEAGVRNPWRRMLPWLVGGAALVGALLMNHGLLKGDVR